MIPILDLDPIIRTEFPEKAEVWKSLGKELRKIMGSVGFIQLINHNIPSDLVKTVFGLSKNFFELPQDAKDSHAKPKFTKIEEYYGYTKSGEETFSKAQEIRETYDWIEGGGKYPDHEIPKFNETIQQFYEICKGLLRTLLRLLALGLDLEDIDYFVKFNRHWDDPKHFRGLWNIRLAYYPPIREDDASNGDIIRIAEHTDFITLTLLFQDDAGGLEAKSQKDGQWMPVTPIKDAIVLNAGDLLEFWTKGIIQATPHRIVVPDSEIQRGIPRYSVVCFHGPDKSTFVTPLGIKKTEEEEQRLTQLQKSYSDVSVNAYEHTMGKLEASYASQNN